MNHVECNGGGEKGGGGEVEEEVVEGAGGEEADEENDENAPAAPSAAAALSPGSRCAWFRASDSHVERVSVDAVESCEAYILLYAREED